MNTPPLDIGDEKTIRELVERALQQGWCRRPDKLSRDEEIEMLRARIAELEGEGLSV